MEISLAELDTNNNNPNLTTHHPCCSLLKKIIFLFPFPCSRAMCQQEGAMCLVWRQLRVFTSWQQLRVWSSVVQSVECVKDSRHIAALRHTCRPTQPHPASAGGAVNTNLWSHSWNKKDNLFFYCLIKNLQLVDYFLKIINHSIKKQDTICTWFNTSRM